MPGYGGKNSGLVKGPFAMGSKPGFGKTYFSNQTQPGGGMAYGSRKKKTAKKGMSKGRY